MKALILIIAASSIGYGQPVKTLPKKTEELITNNTLSKSDNYENVISILIGNGYMLDIIDKELGMVVTRPKKVKSSDVVLNFIIRDGSVTLTGRVNANIDITIWGVTSNSSWDNINNRGVKNSIYYDSFMEMYNIYTQI